MQAVEIPEGVTTIGISAFLFCENLKEIILPASVEKIGKSAFCGCWNLTKINLPDGLTEIAENLFGNCLSLNNIKLPDGLKKIGNQAFKGCETLTEIKIPANVREVGEKIFADCELLSKIYCAAGSDFARILTDGNRAEIITFDEPAPCKENFTWQIDGGTLKIIGGDALKKISCDENSPWYDERERIKKIIIE